MNVLSKHIRITQKDFEPVLIQALRKSILLIFSPYDFYCHEIDLREKVTLNSLKNMAKYVKINKHLLNEFIKAVEAKSDSLSKKEALDTLIVVFESIDQEPEEFESYLNLFSEIVPLGTEIIYAEMDEQENKEAIQNLNEKFSTKMKTVNDQLKSKDRESLVDKHLKKVESIKRHISVNQRYRFVHELFEGNQEAFNKAVDSLEKFNTFQEAVACLTRDYALVRKWDMESDQVKELLDIIYRRYN